MLLSCSASPSLDSILCSRPDELSPHQLLAPKFEFFQSWAPNVRDEFYLHSSFVLLCSIHSKCRVEQQRRELSLRPIPTSQILFLLQIFTPNAGGLSALGDALARPSSYKLHEALHSRICCFSFRPCLFRMLDRSKPRSRTDQTYARSWVQLYSYRGRTHRFNWAMHCFGGVFSLATDCTVITQNLRSPLSRKPRPTCETGSSSTRKFLVIWKFRRNYLATRKTNMCTLYLKTCQT